MNEETNTPVETAGTDAGTPSTETASSSADVQRSPDETEPELTTQDANESVDDDGTVPDHLSGTPFTIGDTVRIAPTFPKYTGELARIKAARMDPAGGDFAVVDIELLKQTQVHDGAPIWFSNVALKDIVLVEG